MCLAVPGKVVEWTERDNLFATAAVEFAGIRRQISMACVPEADVGDYVLVHAGVAISRLDAAEAQRVLAALAELDLADTAETDPHAELVGRGTGPPSATVRPDLDV